MTLFYLIILIGILVILYYVYKIYNTKETENNTNEYHKKIYEYELKEYLTPSELDFYHKLDYFNTDYIVVPQVNLASIINKKNSKYRSELFRNVDFAIFTKDFKLLVLIELNDSSHEQIKRKDRDLKLKKILNSCNVKLLNFYTKYPNERDYVIERITNTIKSN